MAGPPPPLPPPKPSSHEASRISTPVTGLPSTVPREDATKAGFTSTGPAASGLTPSQTHSHEDNQDPGDQWLPKILQDKSKQDLADILANPSLINALTHSPETIHPSLKQSHQALQVALSNNLEMGSHLLQLEQHLSHQRSTTQAQLLSTHALDRQWRQKQSDMDHALSPFSPTSLYQQLQQAVNEQGSVCHVLEESFLEGEGNDAPASEREALDWVKRYREAKSLYYLRQERKSRWDEGRVGGWR